MLRTAFALLLLASPALAQDRLDRMETLTETMTTRLFQNALNGDMTGVDMSALDWDSEMREAADCVLQAYIAETSEDEIDALFGRMESVLEEDTGTIEEMSERFASLDGVLSEERAMEINRSCGMMQLQMQRMQQSGLMQALMERGTFD